MACIGANTVIAGHRIPPCITHPPLYAHVDTLTQYYTQDHFQDLVFICLRLKRIHSCSSNCSYGFSLVFRRAGDVPVAGYWNRGGTHLSLIHI